MAATDLGGLTSRVVLLEDADNLRLAETGLSQRGVSFYEAICLRDHNFIWTEIRGLDQNDNSIVRLVGALLLEQNDEWQLQRRYTQLEGLNTVSDNQISRLSAVITG